MPGTAVATSRCVPAPRQVRSGVRTPAHRRTQGRSVCGAKDLGKSITYRELRRGWLPEGLCCYDCCRTLCSNAVRVPTWRTLLLR
jgi:hypothetical protein